MSDFIGNFWSGWVAVITLLSILACGVLLKAMSTKRTPGQKAEIHGHVWDEDLQELNNPLPRWWMWLFYITIAFALVYLILYPGLGSYRGYFDWSSQSQYGAETAQAKRDYDPVFNKYLKLDILSVAADPEARQIGQRLFLTHCSQCHGSDAGGTNGFPSLRDHDWLYGGDPQSIHASILNGRNGVMPPFAATFGESEIKEAANYVLSLSARPHNAALAALGKNKFAANCAACHTPAGTGMHALGAPNLTDKIWLYGGSENKIMETIAKGRTGVMPAQKDILDDAKVHLLTAYVFGLSRQSR